MDEWKETEIGKIPVNWEMLSIGNFCDVTKLAGFEYTQYFEYVDHGEIIALRALNVREGVLELSDVKRIYKEVSNSLPRSKLIKNDILFTYVGANIGQFALVPENDKYHLAPNICRIRCNDGYFSYYLYSYFRTNFFRDSLEGFSHGSSQPTLPMSSIRKIPIPLPPLPEQKAIAAVLSSLDDKIDLLHRQNKTLEALAETLFRQWFVEEAQDDWERVTLDEYVDCITGYSYRSIDLNPSNIALVTLKNFARDGSFRMDGFKEYTGNFKESQIVKQGDLVISHTDITQEADIIGNPALIIDTGQYKTLIITMDLMKVESTKEWLSKEFLFYLFKSPDFKFHCLGCSNGTTVLHMSRKAIPSYEFRMPNKEKIIAYTENIKSIIEKKIQNISQIRTLEKLRDTLLPKLMSGEVRVKLL